MNIRNRGRISMVWTVFALYIFLSALGLTLIKMGGPNLSIGYKSGVFNFKLDIKLISGLIFYVISFILFIIIMPKFDLSYIYPIAAGALYILIALFALFILGEKILLGQWIGMTLIIAGIISMNIGK